MSTSSQQYPRWQASVLQQALQTRRVLLLEGPRQCGKTTIARSLGISGAIYRTLDNPTLLQAAIADPPGFIKHGDHLLIIDEIQRAPQLLPAIKQDVDDIPTPGRYLLTGSANINALPNNRESLAGRVRKIRLRPLSLGEIRRRPASFVSHVFRADPETALRQMLPSTVAMDKDGCLLAALSGGFPEPLRDTRPSLQRQWHRDYVDALIERDLKDVAKIRDTENLRRLLEVLAAWSSRLIDTSTLCAQAGLSRPTVESYIAALSALYLVEKVRPWQSSDYDRIGKQDKFFITDTGLMSAVLGWSMDKVRLNGDLNGKLIETYVHQQLRSHLDAAEEPLTIWHYRDREKREIDFIIEHPDGALVAIEVKAGSTVTHDMFKHMRWFRQHLAKDRPFNALLLYTGNEVLSFGDRCWAVPITCLG